MKPILEDKKRFNWKYFLGFLFKSFFVLGMIGSLWCIDYVNKTLEETPTITQDLMNKATANTTQMFDVYGELIYQDTNHLRNYIALADVPELYINFLISTEDKDFYNTKGFSLKGLSNAVFSTIKSKVFKSGEARGGSTIDQQLIKNLVFSSNESDRTIDRKIKELFLSVQLNDNFSKNDILEKYINLIYLGEGSYGANTISITYYGKPISQLSERTPENISKLAIIAGLGQAPSAYNLYDNPEETKQRRNIVLGEALKDGLITQEEYDLAINVNVTDGLKERYWRNEKLIEINKEHSAYISSALNEIKSLGYDLTTTPLQIHTALNRESDSELKRIIDEYEDYQGPNQQVAVTVTNPVTGIVLAQYGGRHAEAFGINRATQQTRSSGSTIKPFLDYLPAIDLEGLDNTTLVDSSNYTYPGTDVVASNYGRQEFGLVQLETALIRSMNTPAIRMLDEVVGPQQAKNYLKRMGLDVKDSYGGSDALGLNVSTEQMAGAWSVIANKGFYKKPQYITHIVFNDGSTRYIDYKSVKVAKESTAYILSQILNKVPSETGTASFAQLPFEGYAVKTGTVAYSDGMNVPDGVASDIWTTGTTKNVSVALWTGYDEPNQEEHWIVESLKTDQKLFKQVMEYFNYGLDTSNWELPETVVNEGGKFKPLDVGSQVGTFNHIKDNQLYYFNPNISVLNEDTYSLNQQQIDLLNWQSTETRRDVYELWVQYDTPLEALSKVYKLKTQE